MHTTRLNPPEPTVGAQTAEDKTSLSPSERREFLMRRGQEKEKERAGANLDQSLKLQALLTENRRSHLSKSHRGFEPSLRSFGLIVDDYTRLTIPTGKIIVMNVESGSYAQKLGFRKGDVISNIGGIDLNSLRPRSLTGRHHGSALKAADRAYGVSIDSICEDVKNASGTISFGLTRNEPGSGTRSRIISATFGFPDNPKFVFKKA